MPENVTVYTTPSWPHCTHVKEFLSQKGVKYRELNVAENEAARSEMIRKTGRMAVPTIKVGEQVVVGFDRNQLERLLNWKGPLELWTPLINLKPVASSPGLLNAYIKLTGKFFNLPVFYHNWLILSRIFFWIK